MGMNSDPDFISRLKPLYHTSFKTVNSPYLYDFSKIFVLVRLLGLCRGTKQTSFAASSNEFAPSSALAMVSEHPCVPTYTMANLHVCTRGGRIEKKNNSRSGNSGQKKKAQAFGSGRFLNPYLHIHIHVPL